MKIWVVIFACLAMALSSSAAHAGPFLGGTITVHISDDYYNYFTGIGGAFAPDGLAVVDPGDPQTYLLPITADESTGRNGFAAVGSGISFVLPLAPLCLPYCIFADIGEFDGGFWQTLGVLALGNDASRGTNGLCNFLQLNADVIRGRPGTMGITGDTQLTNDLIGCFASTGVPLGITADLLALATRPQGLDYFEFDVAPAAVPEPATLALVGAGVGVMIARRRRRA
jgi:hypothetical protein